MNALQLLRGRVRTTLVSSQRYVLATVSGQELSRPAQLDSLRTREGWQALWHSTCSVLVFAAAYLAGYVYGNGVPSPPSLPSAFWPPDAILLSAFLLTAPRRWWMYVLVTFPIRMVPALAPGVPTWLLIVNWLNDTLKVLLAAALVRHFAPRPLRFTTLRTMGVYLASAVLVAPVLSAFVGAAGLVTLGASYWQAWRSWFLGDALASLVLTPTIVMWATAGLSGLRPASRQRALEGFLLAAALLVVGGLMVFARVALVTENGLYYLPLPLLVWAAVRFGPRGIASALTVVTCFAVLSVAGFGGYVISASTLHDILSLQLFLIATAVPLLLLAAQIEERKQVVEELRGSEERFRAAFTSAATGMMLVDPNGRFVQVNQPVVTMLGYSEEELRTHTFMDLTYPDDLERNLMLLHRALAGEITSYHLEKRYLHKNGSLVWGRVSAGVVRDAAGHPLYLVSQLEDITAQKRLEREREEARASELALRETKAQMDTFLGIASHELKTPLTSLKLSLQSSQRQLRKLTQGTDGAALRDYAGLPSAVEQLSRTAHQMERMESLVNDLVDVSRIQAGKLELRPEQVDLVAVVQDAVAAQREAAPERIISLHRLDDLSVPVHADAGRIEQVVTNFLTNALKYSPTDRPVEVGVEMVPRGQKVRVWVRDEGQGLPLSEQEHIWERFHRVQGVEVQSGAGVGLGLGLYVSRMIVERHQGQVGVWSTPGQGATFWFTLPLTHPE